MFAFLTISDYFCNEMKQGTILIVDDNRNILTTVKMLLEDTFEKTVAIANPNNIPAKLRDERPDVVLLDMNFQSGINNGNEGLYWLRHIRKTSPQTQVVLFEAVTPGATDYSSAVRKVGQSKAQALMWGGYYPEAAKILSNMYTAGLEIPMIGPDGLKDMGFVQLAGEDAEGVYASGPTDTSANPLSIYYAKKHQEKFGTAPGAFFDNGVAATIALLNAINVAQSTDTDKIMEALRNTEVDTPIGRIKFDEKGDAIGVGMSIYKIEGGQYKEVFKN